MNAYHLLGEMNKSAARGDQILKSLRALATRAAHGTPASSAGAATRLDRATNYGLQRGADGGKDVTELQLMLQQKPMLGGDKALMALTGRKGRFNADYAKRQLSDVDPAWVSQPGPSKPRLYAEQILAALTKAGK